ncbi:MAG: hypothetical protein KBD36_03230, partial [Alphaproteobacteria bacterium]|nr:hypothetical protein [Alphaproteobacteria bacterium]
GMTRTDIIVLPLASLNDEQTQKCKDTLFLSQIRNYLLRSNHAGVIMSFAGNSIQCSERFFERHTGFELSEYEIPNTEDCSRDFASLL